MADIRFYHLETKTLEQVLPALLQKILQRGHKIVLVMRDQARLSALDTLLWTHPPDGFLPHGRTGDKESAHHPLLLSDAPINDNGADILILCDYETVPEKIGGFTMCCDFVDGRKETDLSAARARWKAYQAAGHTVTYWQQSTTGSWIQKT